jgi:hypothetical protein
MMRAGCCRPAARELSTTSSCRARSTVCSIARIGATTTRTERDFGMNWVERSDTHQLQLAKMGFAKGSTHTGKRAHPGMTTTHTRNPAFSAIRRDRPNTPCALPHLFRLPLDRTWNSRPRARIRRLLAAGKRGPPALPSLQRTMATTVYARCSSRAVSSLGMSSITSCPHASSSCHQRRSPALA